MTQRAAEQVVDAGGLLQVMAHAWVQMQAGTVETVAGAQGFESEPRDSLAWAQVTGRNPVKQTTVNGAQETSNHLQGQTLQLHRPARPRACGRGPRLQTCHRLF